MAKQQVLEVTIWVRVTCPESFASVAKHRARLEGETHDEAMKTYTKENLTACAIMIFDPGDSPGGCTIMETEAVELNDI